MFAHSNQKTNEPDSSLQPDSQWQMKKEELVRSSSQQWSKYGTIKPTSFGFGSWLPSNSHWVQKTHIFENHVFSFCLSPSLCPPAHWLFIGMDQENFSALPPWPAPSTLIFWIQLSTQIFSFLKLIKPFSFKAQVLAIAYFFVVCRQQKAVDAKTSCTEPTRSI